MDIIFCKTKLKNICNDEDLCRKAFGDTRAKLLRRRLDDLRAAANLQDMKYLPGSCHELKGNLDGKLAISLDGPYRLIFAVANDPQPKKQDGGLNWDGVTRIEILGVEDYHG